MRQNRRRFIKTVSGAAGLTASGAFAAQSQPPSSQSLPEKVDYMWALRDQSIVLHANDGTGRASSKIQRGLAIDRNGDWLLLTGGFYRNGSYHWDPSITSLLRSSDAGKSWQPVSVLPNFGNHQDEFWFFYNGLVVTPSGRLVASCVRFPLAGGTATLLQHRLLDDQQFNEGKDIRIGESPEGRFLYTQIGFIHRNSRIYSAYSDDGGLSWTASKALDTTPLIAANVSSSGQLVRDSQGTIVIPFDGHVEEGDDYGFVMCSAYVASHDNGETWGKPTIVAKGEDHHGQWYNEIAILPAEDRWLALVRMNPMSRMSKPSSHGTITGYRCWSTDRGKIWTLPEPVLGRPGYPSLFQINDGAIAYGSGAWHNSYMRISYDGGASWAYDMQIRLSGGGNNYWIQPDDDTVVQIARDIEGTRIQMNRFHKKPIRTSISTTPPRIPDHRWTMRELKNIHFAKGLQPFVRMARCSSGRLVVVGLNVEPASENSVVFCLVSDDGGKEWSRPRTITGPEKYAHLYPASLDATPDGTLALVCAETTALPNMPFALEDASGESTRIRTLVSADEGETWKELSPLDRVANLTAMRPGPAITVDAGGNWRLPVAGVRPDSKNVCGFVSSSKGKDWAGFTPLVEGGEADVLDPPALLPVGRNRWLAFYRSSLAEFRERFEDHKGGKFRQPPLCRVTSDDGGSSWSQPVEVAPASHPFLARLPDGGVLLSSYCTNEMRYQVSYTGGASWSFENRIIGYPLYYLADDNYYSMSDVSFVTLDEKTLLAAYFVNDEWEGGPRLSVTWIRALPKDSVEARESGL